MSRVVSSINVKTKSVNKGGNKLGNAAEMDRERGKGEEPATEKGLCRAEHHREEGSFVCALPAS